MSINASIHAFFGIELLQTCIETIVSSIKHFFTSCFISIFNIFFSFLAKILVAAEINDCKTSIEIIDLLDPQSKYAFVDKRAEKFNIRPYFGGVLQNRPFLLLNFYGSTKAKAKALHIKNKTHILQLLCDNERRKQNDVGVILNDDTCWSINETPPRCANYCL